MHLARPCRQMQFSAAPSTLSALYLVSNPSPVLLLKRLALFCHVQQSGLRLPDYPFVVRRLYLTDFSLSNTGIEAAWRCRVSSWYHF